MKIIQLILFAIFLASSLTISLVSPNHSPNAATGAGGLTSDQTVLNAPNTPTPSTQPASITTTTGASEDSDAKAILLNPFWPGPVIIPGQPSIQAIPQGLRQIGSTEEAQRGSRRLEGMLKKVERGLEGLKVAQKGLERSLEEVEGRLKGLKEA